MIGDAAYPISPFLLTPFRLTEALTAKQRNYNYKLCATRVVIENTFGILKQRFRQLQLLDFHTVDKITKFIMTVCVLHNLCIMKNDTEAFFDGELELPPPQQDFPERVPRNDLRASALKLLGRNKRKELTDALDMQTHVLRNTH